jgi:hypothetical protein
MNRASVLAASAFVTLMAPAHAQVQTVTLGDDGLVTVSDNVTPYEIFNSSASQVESGEAVLLIYRIDPEAGPEDLDAIVLVGQFGTGIEPLVLRIDARGERPLVIEAASTRNTFDVTIGGHTYALAVRRDSSVEMHNVVVGRLS